jgi:hypothetical protein
MKYIKDFKLFETGDGPKFTDYEISELEKLGFKNKDGNIVYGSNIFVSKDSLVFEGDVDEWYTLSINSKQKKYDTFEELIKNIKLKI